MLDAHKDIGCSGEVDFIFDYLSEQQGSWVYDTDRVTCDWIFQGFHFKLPDGENGEDIAIDFVTQFGRARKAILFSPYTATLRKLLPFSLMQRSYTLSVTRET